LLLGLQKEEALVQLQANRAALADEENAVQAEVAGYAARAEALIKQE
jgi:hypothetical protein